MALMGACSAMSATEQWAGRQPSQHLMCKGTMRDEYFLRCPDLTQAATAVSAQLFARAACGR